MKFDPRWPQITLGELTASTRPICYGVLKPGPEVAGGIPLLKIQDLVGDRVSMAGVQRISPALDAEFSRSRLGGGEVLLSIQGTVGRVALVPHELAGANISRTLAVINPDGRMEPAFLCYALRAIRAAGAFEVGGTTRASLNISTIRSMKLPVPELQEQRRIVELLEDHLSRLDAAVDLLSRAAARKAALEAGWLASRPAIAAAEQRPLGSLLASPLRHGRSVATAERGFPVLRLTALKTSRVDLSERKVGAWTPQEAAAFLVSRGDFLVARGSGSLRLVGRGSLVDVDPDPVAYPDTAIRVRPASDMIAPEFLALVWNSRPVRTQIESVAKTTAGIHKVNQAELGRVMVPLPDLRSQGELVAQADGFFSATRRLDGMLIAAQHRAAALRRSLLAAAFAGRLTDSVTHSEGLHV